jgi:hypothetical protein
LRFNEGTRGESRWEIKTSIKGDRGVKRVRFGGIQFWQIDRILREASHLVLTNAFELELSLLSSLYVYERRKTRYLAVGRVAQEFARLLRDERPFLLWLIRLYSRGRVVPAPDARWQRRMRT